MFAIVLSTVATAGISAQITISIPGFKKIKKPEIVTTNTNVTDTNINTTNDARTNSGNSSGNWWIDYQIGEISKYKQQVDGWNPSTQVFPRPSSSDDYIGLALSKAERAEWLRDKKMAPDDRLEASLDELKASLTRRMPEYTINTRSFNYRNAAEEKLILAELSDIPGMKVHKIGFNQATWVIDRNEWGIPKARYKHGLVYGRNPKSEDPFCRIWYVNVVQEYTGAGTYGPTEARYIEREFIACPAG
jgi:hypothetical protein